MRTARVGDAAAAAVREILAWDWTNLGLVAAFLLCLPLPGGWPGVLAWLSGLTQTTDAIRYEQAIRAAAIKSPDSAQVLATIAPDQTETDIVKIGFVPMQGDAVKDDIFVALASELQKRCAGATDPQTAVQQILGLPPVSVPRSASRLKVATSDLFRPCLSTDSLQANTCSSTWPADGANKHLDFVIRTMTKSYRIGFRREGTQGDDYPYDGYPFTGMGYTYDWDQPPGSRFGVSEFVLQKGAKVLQSTPLDLAAFCHGR